MKYLNFTAKTDHNYEGKGYLMRLFERFSNTVSSVVLR